MLPAEPAKEMPFLDHLEELRKRLLWVLGTLIVCAALGVVAVLRLDLITKLAAPALPFLPRHKLVFTHPAELIQVVTMLSLTVGLIMALPVILYHLWGFVAPALFPKEKRIAVAVLTGGFALFLAGVALSYFFVIPAAMQLNSSIQGDSVEAMLTINDYFSFVTTLALTFGGTFELPLVIMALSALGLVTPTFLRKYRRHAVVLCVVAAAVITPGDAVTSTVYLMIPLYFLFELGILLSAGVQRWRLRRELA